MTGTDDSNDKSAKPAKSGSRDARLAAALRENLRRRKAQERGRGQTAGPDGDNRPGQTGAGDKNR